MKRGQAGRQWKLGASCLAWTVAATLAGSCASAPSAKPGIQTPAAESTQAVSALPLPAREVLPNGLEVIWFLSDRLPVTDLVLLVKSGYRDDPMGKTGTSELVSSVLDRGAGGMTAQQIARSVEMLGASRYSS